MSLASGACQIITLALTHYVLTLARSSNSNLARFLDGTPLTLFQGGHRRADTMSRMRIQDDDVMAMARDQGIRTLNEIGVATLERNGEISIIKSSENKG